MKYNESILTYSIEPIGCTENHGIRPKPKYKYSLVACAKWEEKYICEWIEYHQSIGIDHIYLYSNDDCPEPLYDCIRPYISGSNPFVTFRHYPIPGQQYQMYFHFLRNFSTETEWLMFLDIDEFLCIKGSNYLPQFMAGLPKNIDGIHFNWCCYGNNGYENRPDGHVLINYTKREKNVNAYTKVLIKSEKIPYKEIYQASSAPIMHEYNGLDPSLNMINALGDDVGKYYIDFPSTAMDLLNSDNRKQTLLSVAYIAHFSMKSNADFEIRVLRGTNGDYRSEQIWGTYSQEQRENYHKGTNEVSDYYLHDYWMSQNARAWDLSIFPQSRWINISQNKTATQSSTVHTRHVEEDACRVLSGNLCGKCQNHTALEQNPWWKVDLEAPCLVHEMRLFNRLDGVPERVANFVLEGSVDDLNWFVMTRKNDGIIYGGADGHPYIWIDQTGIQARFLKITIPGKEAYLHFDQIQFFGGSVV